MAVIRTISDPAKINVKLYANDMQYDYTIVEVEGGVRVFAN